MDETQNFKQDERIALKLRRLFESRGFKRVNLGKFEEYDLYIENRNFLQSDQMITFMDMNGKLMALKPDVTLSVVKNIPAKPLPTFQKLYYVDEIYRMSPENREFRALNQIGVELVGDIDLFANIEVVDLALTSLAVMGERYILDLSHLGFVRGLLGELELSHGKEQRILSAIHAKSGHDVRAILEQAEVEGEAQDCVLALSQLHGPLPEVLPRARALIRNDGMQEAYDELSTVAEALGHNGFSGHLNLDFSVVNDLGYYNGLMFHGYVQGLPQGVLNGGRYDNLMHKMGKKSGAIGFGVSLDQFNTYFRSGRHYDFDLLIAYDEDSDWKALLAKVKELTAAGKTVRLERAGTDLSQADFVCESHCRFSGNKLIMDNLSADSSEGRDEA